jgi:hypothetical protein
MTGPGAAVTMPPKKKAKVGRPKTEEPLRSLLSLKGSERFEVWLDALVDHAHQGTRSLLVRNALREFAEKSGFSDPMPKR